MRGLCVALGFLTATCAMLLSGCAHPPPPPARFSKMGANQQTFMQDRFACIQQAQQNRSAAAVYQGSGQSISRMVVSRPVFTSCLGARGYLMNPSGPLVADPGTEVLMVD